MKLIALKPVKYAGKAYKTGDEFLASDRDASVLITVRLARNAEDVTATVKPKRAYRRRDMRAEN